MRVSPFWASSFSAWKRNQKTLGGGRNRQDRWRRPASMPPVPLEPPLRGTRTCQVLQCFRRAKSEWRSASPSGPLGPDCSKIAASAVSLPRLALPSQRSRCVFGREPQGAPLPKFRKSVLETRRGGARPSRRSKIRRAGLGPAPAKWGTASVFAVGAAISRPSLPL